ncbi:MAG: hypothetical protein HQM02_03285 [Magnetococcales bacterium]|nr:hypothetical protein [Magnetococcales bacterium]
MKTIRKSVWMGVCLPLLLASGGGVAAQEEPTPRELLSQFVDIDRGDFKAKGKVTLHRLQPLAGRLQLSSASGNPEWIFKTIAPWNPNLAKVLGEMNIRELTLEEGSLLLDGKLVDLQLNKAVIPEGWLEGVVLKTRDEGSWNIRTHRLRLERVPGHFNRFALPLQGAVGFERMQASGNARQGSGQAEGIFAGGWRGTRLTGSGEVVATGKSGQPATTKFDWQADGVDAPAMQGLAGKVPLVREILRFVGQEIDGGAPLHFDQMRLQVMVEASGAARIRNLRLVAPWGEIGGEGALEPGDKTGGGRLTLNLTARRGDGQQKRFKGVFPIAALGEP